LSGLYSHTTRADGTTLTAAIYNADHQNHINNAVPDQHDDWSSTVSQMQTTTDPYPGGAESQATNLAGELERLRYLIAQITGEAQWYIDPDITLATLAGLGISNHKAPDDENTVVAARMYGP
jgi:hypothetical protein